MPLWKRRLQSLVAGFVLMLCAAPAQSEWVDWILDGDLTFEFNDNVNNSAFTNDKERDYIFHPHLALGRVYQIAERTRVSILAEVTGDVYVNFTGLDAIHSGGDLAVFHKFGIGNAPWIRSDFWGGYSVYRDDFRSGRRLEAGIQGGKRFTNRFDASLRYRFTDRNGKDGPRFLMNGPTDVFDQQYHQVTLKGNFQIFDRLSASAGYTFRYGEFDSGVLNKLHVPTVLAVEDIKAAALDSNGVGGWVYKLKGAGHAAFVKLNYGFADRVALDAGYRFDFGKGDKLSYQRNTFELALIIRY